MTLVSCLMPTYGRASIDLSCLQEAVYWFLAQKAQGEVHQELLIVNDAPGQTLECAADGVRVINLEKRFGSLGEKYNFMVQEAAGEILLPWEDDDISLPHRVQQAVTKLREDGDFEYWNPRKSFYEDAGKLYVDHKQGVNHNASAYTKKFALRSPYQPVNNQDRAFDTAAVHFASVNPKTLTLPAEWSYVYRWGFSPAGHLSGHTDVDAGYRNWLAPEPGRFRIEPKMHRNYARDLIALRTADPGDGRVHKTPAMAPGRPVEALKARARLTGYDIDGVATRGVRPKPEDAALYVSGRKTDAFERTIRELGSRHPIYLRPASMGPDGSEQHGGQWKAAVINLHGVERFYDDSPVCVAIIRASCPGCEVILVVDGIPQEGGPR